MALLLVMDGRNDERHRWMIGNISSKVINNSERINAIMINPFERLHVSGEHWNKGIKIIESTPAMNQMYMSHPIVSSGCICQSINVNFMRDKWLGHKKEISIRHVCVACESPFSLPPDHYDAYMNELNRNHFYRLTVRHWSKLEITVCFTVIETSDCLSGLPCSVWSFTLDVSLRASIVDVASQWQKNLNCYRRTNEICSDDFGTFTHRCIYFAAIICSSTSAWLWWWSSSLASSSMQKDKARLLADLIE